MMYTIFDKWSLWNYKYPLSGRSSSHSQPQSVSTWPYAGGYQLEHHLLNGTDSPHREFTTQSTKKGKRIAMSSAHLQKPKPYPQALYLAEMKSQGQCFCPQEKTHWEPVFLADRKTSPTHILSHQLFPLVPPQYTTAAVLQTFTCNLLHNSPQKNSMKRLWYNGTQKM